MFNERDLEQALRFVKSGFISLKEAAASRKVSKAAIHLLIKRKRLRKVELFGQLLLYKREVKKFIKCTPGPRPGPARKKRKRHDL